MTNETHLRINPTTAVKKHITEYIDSLVARGNLNITEENYLDLSFKLRATAAKYALEDQHKPQPKTTLDIIGDLHTSAAVRKYLNITQEELDKLVEDHLILKLTDGKGRNGYPAFQFKNGTIRPDIQKIIKTYLDFPKFDNPYKTPVTPPGSSLLPNRGQPRIRRTQPHRTPRQTPRKTRPRNQYAT